MANKSAYLEAALLNEVLRNTNYVPPATVYVGLYTAAPTDAGGGTEISTAGTGYARQSCAFGAPSGTPNSCANTTDVIFGAASTSWGTIVAFGIFDAASAGNLLYWNTMTNKTVGSGDKLEFAPGNLTVSED